jgi:hypothetical protein
MESFKTEWDSRDIRGAIRTGFHLLESKDKIVGFLSIHPTLMKSVILENQEDITFDYIPEGLGFIRTAYLRFKFGRPNEMLFVDQDRTEELVITLK